MSRNHRTLLYRTKVNEDYFLNILKFVNDNKPTYVAQNIMTGAKLLTQ